MSGVEWTVTEVNSGTHKNSKSHIQDNIHVQTPRASVHKEVTKTVVAISLVLQSRWQLCSCE